MNILIERDSGLVSRLNTPNHILAPDRPRGISCIARYQSGFMPNWLIRRTFMGIGCGLDHSKLRVSTHVAFARSTIFLKTTVKPATGPAREAAITSTISGAIFAKVFIHRSSLYGS